MEAALCFVVNMVKKKEPSLSRRLHFQYLKKPSRLFNFNHFERNVDDGIVILTRL
ncbi:MAG: hypothetical protein RL226_2080, partial [Bacteroidota bacterium]